ncbi:SpoIIE family protein phosphatase [Phormidium tenue]|uniref:SpoIIE family protein phosphatase n=1 Tax=Phormidium tenue FACHB-1050 TaxID=2692857 RepID=A0ABR8CI67_9CYAN|nr:SpoIIE family protein phosphatase [Phormidium tenue]MBD2319725.1 SpoIIE family protein phosphatase [Phormidium tenue FACHB-1050]
MTLFKPAIALMNRLKYPQKFFLISLLFVLPLALVMNLLISELDSRIEFTQKELYGTAYLRPLNQLWQYIPQRQLILQRQFYKNAQSLKTSSPSQELPELQKKIEQEFIKLTEVDRQLGQEMQASERLRDIRFKWQGLLDGQEFLGFRNHEALLEEINLFRRHVVDFSNLILDPDLDTYYLMDAIAVKLPEMQKLLYKMMYTEAEIVFNQEVTNEKKARLISLISLLGDYNSELAANLERAFQNNLRGNLRNALSIHLRNFVVSISEVNTYISQLASQDNNISVIKNFYYQEMERTLDDSFTLWQKVVEHLDELLEARIQRFQERKQFVLTFVAIVMVSIVYLFVGFYLSVMRTVHQLDIASKQMTSGGTISIKLDSKDELSMVVRSFNSVAIALRESEEKYRSIFENSVDGIFQTTVDGRYLSVNPALARIYGYDSVEQMLAQIVDVKTQLYVDRDRRQQFQSLMEENDTITNFESQVYKRDRTTIWISENVRALRDAQGQILYYEGTVEDISQRKIAEIALDGANKQILALNNLLKLENLRMSSELDVTRKLQQMILPKEQELELIAGLDIAGFMEPAAEVGGDYYDVLQQNGRIKIGIGDVTGHGLESGMLMIMVQTAVRTLLQSEENDPVRFLDILNRTIYGNVQRMSSDKNLTLSLIDYEQGKLILSGQHEEMILVRKNGTLERFDTIDLGFPIGLEEEIFGFLDQKHIHLHGGDVVVLYTDGITEAEDEERKLYGVDRLCEVVRQNVEASALEIRQAVIADLRSHIGNQKIYDDITLLVLKQK